MLHTEMLIYIHIHIHDDGDDDDDDDDDGVFNPYSLLYSKSRKSNIELSVAKYILAGIRQPC